MKQTCTSILSYLLLVRHAFEKSNRITTRIPVNVASTRESYMEWLQPVPRYVYIIIYGLNEHK